MKASVAGEWCVGGHDSAWWSRTTISKLGSVSGFFSWDPCTPKGLGIASRENRNLEGKNLHFFLNSN